MDIHVNSTIAAAYGKQGVVFNILLDRGSEHPGSIETKRLPALVLGLKGIAQLQ